jgi:outer membrane lipoprotein-sorting protein
MVTVSQAQYDENALKVLDAMSAKYKQIGAYSADIVYSLLNESDGINEQFTGNITVKGEKYLLELEEQIILNDGITIWTYLPDVNEVNIDNNNPDDEEISPSKIYDAYKDGYKYLYVGDETIGGKKHAVIDLVPNDREAQFFKIKLFINASDYSLTKWTMYDKSGNLYNYSINNFNASINPADDIFEFDPAKYPGVEIIDLR